MKIQQSILRMAIALVFATVAANAWAANPKPSKTSPAKAPAATAMEYRGDIIDSHCLAAHKTELSTFLPTHTKECVLLPKCQASGMNLVQADGSVLKFDKASAKKIVAFLKKKDSKLQVVVMAKKTKGGQFALVSIKNQ